MSWNCGAEGETVDPTIIALRQRQAKNFIAILMLSQGVPMLQSGDEVLRTQRGNNNNYCQDNELSWFDWSLVKKNHEMLDFTRAMIEFRRSHPTLRRNRFLTGKSDGKSDLPDIVWHGVELEKPGFDDPNARTLAFTLAGKTKDEPPLHVMMNMSDRVLEFALPELPGIDWSIVVDTSQHPGVLIPGDQPQVKGRCRLENRSVVVLVGYTKILLP